MIIAINTRVISGETIISKILVDYFLKLALIHPQHQFILIAEQDIRLLKSLPHNLEQHVLPQQSDNSLFWKLWYHYKLPAAVRKLKVDKLISTDGISSKRIKIPQYLVVNELGFINAPQNFPANYSRFAKLNSADFFRKAKKIIALSSYVKTEIIKNFKISDSKISVWHPGILELYKPLDFEAAEKIKEQHTEGKDYFLFYGAIQTKSNLVTLLKAFSLFKKRQKSNMQLVLAVSEINPENEFVKSIALYKYKDDVKLIVPGNEQELASIIGAAYACINTSALCVDIISLLRSLKSAVPVIAGNYFSAIDYLGEAALYTDASSVDVLAEKMMLLYKDEKARNEIIDKGLAQAKQYNETNALNELGNILFSTNQSH